MDTLLLAAVLVLLLAAAWVAWALEIGNEASRRLLTSLPPDD